MGSQYAFALALVLVLLWTAIGSHYRYSDGWQLVINTATNVLALVIVFLIQNTQNRDSAACHRKLDQIIRALEQLQASRQLESETEQDVPELALQVRREWVKEDLEYKQ